MCRKIEIVFDNLAWNSYQSNVQGRTCSQRYRETIFRCCARIEGRNADSTNYTDVNGSARRLMRDFDGRFNTDLLLSLRLVKCCTMTLVFLLSSFELIFVGTNTASELMIRIYDLLGFLLLSRN